MIKISLPTKNFDNVPQLTNLENIKFNIVKDA